MRFGRLSFAPGEAPLVVLCCFAFVLGFVSNRGLQDVVVSLLGAAAEATKGNKAVR